MTTRLTVHVFDRFLSAWFVCRAMQDAGVDAKVVTKHAVQIDPRQVNQARAALACIGKTQRFKAPDECVEEMRSASGRQKGGPDQS